VKFFPVVSHCRQHWWPSTYTQIYRLAFR